MRHNIPRIPALTSAAISAVLVTSIAASPASAIDTTSHAIEGHVFDIPSATIDPRLEQLSSYMSVVDDTAHFDYAAATRAGIDPSYLDEFATGFARAGHVDGTTKYNDVTKLVEPLATCYGRNRAWIDGWGAHIEVDTCNLDVIINAMLGNVGTVGTIGAVLLRIPGIGSIGAGIAGLVSGFLTFGASMLRNCGYPGGRPVGATIHLSVVPWCGTQS